MNGGDFFSSPLQFQAYSELVVDHVNPSSGPMDGGTVVTIYGSFFFSNLLKCKFGFAAIVQATFIDENTLTCISPRSENIGVGVQVTANGAEPFTKSKPFYFYRAPSITNLEPTRGPAFVATNVRITGIHLNVHADEVLCKFGTIEAKAVLSSNSSLSCLAPPQDISEVAVSVSINNGYNWSPENFVFEYVSASHVASVYPARGQAQGGALVRLRGYFNYAPDLQCYFGLSSGTHFIWISDEEIHCKTPPHKPGYVPTRVSSDLDASTEEDFAFFEFLKTPEVLSISPSIGSYLGGTPVTVGGRHLHSSSSGWFCNFDTIRVKGTLIGAEVVECMTPFRANLNSSRVVVSVGHGDFILSSVNMLEFIYTNPPVVTGLSPDYGLVVGGDRVTLYGDNLATSGGAWCRFHCKGEPRKNDIVVAKATAVSTNSIICTSPPKHPYMNDTVFVDVSINAVDWSQTRHPFRYVPPPLVDRVHPQSGMGGTHVLISGMNFVQGTKCKFGVSGTVDAFRHSSAEISCIAPISQYANVVRISLIVNKGPDTRTGFFFRYFKPTSILNIHPTFGEIGGGTLVYITGKNFVKTTDLACKFGIAIVTATFVSNNLIYCMSPPNRLGKQEVGVALNGKDFTRSDGFHPVEFNYIIGMKVIEVVSKNAPLGRPINVTVVGENFKPGLKCRFGSSIIVIASHINPKKIVCEMPPQDTVGRVSVSVTENGHDYTKDPVFMRIIDDAIVSSLSPAIIPEDSIISLVVSGANFLDSPELVCLFGEGHELISARWLSKSQIQCDTPEFSSSPQGKVSLSVSNNYGTSFSQSVSIRLSQKTYVISASPMWSYIEGGTLVTLILNEWNVDSESICIFGIKPAIVIVKEMNLNGQRKLQCRTPSHPQGEVSLQVTCGNNVLYVGEFLYTVRPSLKQLTPSFGYAGTRIVLNGFNMSRTIGCRFTKISSRSANILVAASFSSNDTVICMAPLVQAQTFLVDLTENGQEFSAEQMPFVFQSKPRVFAVYPNHGASLGGTRATINGMNFDDTQELMCRFTGNGQIKVVQAMFVSSRELKCVTPQFSVGSSEVSISANGIDYSNDVAEFQFHGPVNITIVSPDVGTIKGGTTVTVHATNIFFTEQLGCRFGNNNVIATFVGGDSVSCTTPEIREAKEILVSITMNGNDYYGAFPFTFVPGPEVLRIEPTSGWTMGGNDIQVVTKNLYHDPFSLVFCSFGDVKQVQAVILSQDLLVCTSPRMENSIGRQVHIALHYQHTLSKSSGGPIFVYVEPTITTKVDPPFGSVLGGTIVSVSGLNFQNFHDLRCRFGSKSTIADFIDNQKVKCTSPEQQHLQLVVAVEVYSESGSLKTYEAFAQFRYIIHPSVYSIYPLVGISHGGTVVTVTGHGFSQTDLVSCRFGLQPVVAEFITAQKVRCITPSADDTLISGRTVSVSVSMNGHDYIKGNTTTFTYIPPVQVLSLQPSSGPITGATRVQVFFKGLKLDQLLEVSCHFGTHIPSPAKYISSNELTCSSPPVAKPGIVEFELSFNRGNDKTSPGLLFYYYQSPIITNILPNYGLITGGLDVVVTGVGFLNYPGLGCTFGFHASPRALWVSTREIRCVSPPIEPEDARSVVVRVTNNGVDFSPHQTSNWPSFSYEDNPTVTSMLPTTVAPDVGTACVIQGKNLARARLCKFGPVGETSPVLFSSSSELKCKSPPISSSSPYVKSKAELFILFESELAFQPTGISVTYGSHTPTEELYANSLADTFSRPVITGLVPSTTKSSGGQWITVQGINFVNRYGLRCLFGNSIFQAARFISTEEIRCLTSPTLPGKVFLKVVNGGSNIASKHGMLLTFFADSSILFVEPKFGHLHGGTIVTIKGSFPPNCKLHESNLPNALCKFGSAIVFAVQSEQNKIVCATPPMRYPETVKAQISCNNGQSFSESFGWYSYESVVRVMSLNPTYGTINGGTLVLVNGFHFKDSSHLRCKFGRNEPNYAIFISSEEIICKSPPQSYAGQDTLEITVNGVDYSTSRRLFEYRKPLVLASILPNAGGGTQGGTVVTVVGHGFLDESDLTCSFDGIYMQATLIDSHTLSCISPPHAPGLCLFQLLGYRHTNDGAYTSNTKDFRFLTEPSVIAFHPQKGKVQGGTPVFVTGTNLINTTALKCQFGLSVTRGTLINSNILLCPSPPVLEPSSVDLSISLNGLDFSPPATMSFQYESTSEKGHFCGPSHASWGTPAPNGTKASTGAVNFTLCEPGTFQPRSSQTDCMLCPVGAFCPDFGLSQPIICPAGKVCDEQGLKTASTNCPRGHYCEEGTKTYLVNYFTGTQSWSQDDESGLVTTEISHRSWDHMVRMLPATGSRRIEHPPVDVGLTAEQPFPCPIGFYCREGVATNVSTLNNFSTPQLCYDGFFCPRGSFNPEGSGPCPTGYYCPSQIHAVKCPLGYYCPGVGNIEPLPCYPGTYSPDEGRSNCTLCELGHICPRWARDFPELCPGGFVCDTQGLLIPEKECPPGFLCEEGTMTDEPDSSILKGPIFCPPGTFCLGGVAVNATIDWIPNREEGKRTPQVCHEGYYCESGSSSPSGSGPCFPGHYCTPGSPYPTKVPVGTFSSDPGAINPTLCFPGMYTSSKGSKECILCPSGFTCQGYGTYEPKVCRPGTYRSKADSISCVLCPTGTFSPFSGLTDITQCLPCPEGRVCGHKGMSDLKTSEACAGGYICGAATDRNMQYDHKCPGGAQCGSETSPQSQFENMCSIGSYCTRGTAMNMSSVCKNSHFCPPGTSSPESAVTKCPRQTTTSPGARHISNCFTKEVDICDKEKIEPQNPFQELSFYPNNSPRGEMVVLRKILPANESSSSTSWMNSTVEVFRSCPAYGLHNNWTFRKNASIVLIGRHFLNTTTLTCRYRRCLGFDLSFSREKSSLQTCSKQESVRETKGRYLSNTRVECPMFPLQEIGIENPWKKDNSTQNECKMDENGLWYFVPQCIDDEKCDSTSDRRIYSLSMPCSVTELAQGKCENIPANGTRLNPCYSARILVDVSNNGEKFSGDSTFIPYTELHDSTFSRRKDFIIPSTFAVFTIVSNATFGNSSPDNDYLINMDRSLCRRSTFPEEAPRQRDMGWYELPFMSQAHLSFDWRHLPPDLVFDKHYKLAIYAIPSRCHDSRCGEDRVRIPDVEEVPCLQPLELPNWLMDTTVEKNQILNLTLFSLDDAIIRVEVQIVHGLYMASSEFFLNTMSIHIASRMIPYAWKYNYYSFNTCSKKNHFISHYQFCMFHVYYTEPPKSCKSGHLEG